jgi:hypothetical protein
MFALAYASRACAPFQEAELTELAQFASEKNRRLDVTGYLNFCDGVFFQFLEGEESVVRDLMAKIVADERHTVVNRVDLGERPTRLFPDWSMRYVSRSEMRAIRMEDVLENVLLTMLERTFGADKVRDTILRLAERIGAGRGRLKGDAS